MPKKPERPISAMVFPKAGSPWLKLDSLPTEKDELELEIAQRFVVALNKLRSANYQCVQKAIEPGDILLHDENGTDIFLQIGEAVDIHRAKTTSLRKRYGSLLWSDEDLCAIYQGVQVAILDMGEARDLPTPSSKQGRTFLKELSSQLCSLKDIVNSLPLNAKGEFKGKETFIEIHSVPMRINIRLLRYAQPFRSNSCKWLWTGSHQIKPSDNLENFTEVINNKTKHYTKIINPFWLLIYSVDSICEQNTENSLSSMLEKLDHPFERVYLFFPRSAGGEVKGKKGEKKGSSLAIYSNTCLIKGLVIKDSPL